MRKLFPVLTDWGIIFAESPVSSMRTLLNPKANSIASVTKRMRRRRYTNGRCVLQERFVVNFRDQLGKRRQNFFTNKQAAIACRNELIARAVQGGALLARTNLRLSRVLDHWLDESRLKVKPSTWRSYKRVHRYIVGPLAAGTARDRYLHTMSGGSLPKPTLPLIGDIQISDLTTAHIRQWYNTLAEVVGRRTAQEMKRCLGAALRLSAEDFGVIIPALPTFVHRDRDRPPKAVLSPTQVHSLLLAASADERYGIYYAFPYLTGARPSEQLGLLWKDIDFADESIAIARMQEMDGSLSSTTKTSTSTRRIPLPTVLVDMLIRWRSHCPRDRDGVGRVFPTVGRLFSNGTVARAGLPLTYYNFRANYWAPALIACSLPYVTPHSARHTYISTMQAAGVEVGLVAKLVGHANANVTLSHYTHAMRGGEAAVRLLQDAYKL